ncbi:hypothetical protein [Terrimonas alba]|uniref:hypothetical protein n=1 Tax=Terrimonas alba TaxID=3349636 RepID=UPI0035F47133
MSVGPRAQGRLNHDGAKTGDTQRLINCVVTLRALVPPWFNNSMALGSAIYALRYFMSLPKNTFEAASSLANKWIVIF